MRPGISRVAPCASLAGALLVATLTAPALAAPQYHITHEVKLPGDEGWDYLSFDDAGHRLFIAHGSQVLVIDTDQLTPAGAIANTPGVHGIALATDAGHGYISAGRSNTIVVFDLKTLARLKDIQATGENPDAILYDSATHRVFSFNGRGRNATVIDSKTDAVIGTIALDAKPEFAVSDGKGRVYVNLEDKSSIARIDAQHMSVTAVWPLEGCDDPSGLAIDVTGQRLFAGCGNKVMAVVDANSGRTLGTVGAGGKPEVAQSLATQRGARTMALDEHAHRLFLVTASFGPPPAATEQNPHPRPAILPGTFRLLVVAPANDKR